MESSSAIEITRIPETRPFVEEVYSSNMAHIGMSIKSSEERPLKNKLEYDPRLLAEIFPPEKAHEMFNIGITAVHGNEPYIMTAGVALELNEILREHNLKPVPLMLPNIYEGTTKRILLEEFGGHADEIYLSDELARILRKTEFTKAGYHAHLRELLEHQPQVYEELMEFLAKPFDAVSLAGDVREFQPQGRRLEINAGANVTASEPGRRRTHFLFPVLLSEMMEATLNDRELMRYFDKATIAQVKTIAEEFEQRYRTTQLPYVHTLSYQGEAYPREGKLFTPPFKKAKDAPDIELPEGIGIYVMGSGSEIGKEVIEDQALQLHGQGYTIIAPKWFNLDFGTAALPDVIYHPNIRVVMGRHGWGVGWISQVAEKPFIAMPHLWFDNPEMHFNAKTMRKTGLGVVFKHRADIVERALRLAPRIRELNEQMYQELGIPRGKDGIRVAAENIIAAEVNDVAQRHAS